MSTMAASSKSSNTSKDTTQNDSATQGDQVLIPEASIRGKPPTDKEYASIVHLYSRPHEAVFDLNTGTVEDALKWLGHEVELVRRLGHGLHEKQLSLEKQLDEMRTELHSEVSSFQESTRNTNQTVSFALQGVSTFEARMRALLKAIHKRRGDGTSVIRDNGSPAPHIERLEEPARDIRLPYNMDNGEPLNFNVLQRLSGAPMGSDKASAQKLDAIQARDAQVIEEARQPPLPDTISASSQSRVDPATKQRIDESLDEPMMEIIHQLDSARSSILDVLYKYGESMQTATVHKQQQTSIIEGLWKVNDKIINAAVRGGLETKFMVPFLTWLEEKIEPAALETAKAEVEAMRAVSLAAVSDAQNASQQAVLPQETAASALSGTPIRRPDLTYPAASKSSPSSSSAPTYSIALSLESVKPLNELTGQEALDLLKSLSQTVKLIPQGTNINQSSSSSLSSAAAVAPSGVSSTSSFTPAVVVPQVTPSEAPDPATFPPLPPRLPIAPIKASASLALGKRKRELITDEDDPSVTIGAQSVRLSQDTLKRSRVTTGLAEDDCAISSRGDIQLLGPEVISAAASRTRTTRRKRKKT